MESEIGLDPEQNLDVKRDARRRRAYTMYLEGASQASIAKDLGVDRGTVRLDLDAMRLELSRGHEVGPAKSPEVVVWEVYERLNNLRDEIRSRAEKSEGNVMAKLYGEAAEIDLKILERFTLPSMIEVKSKGITNHEKATIDWIAEKFGQEALADLIKYLQANFPD